MIPEGPYAATIIIEAFGVPKPKGSMKHVGRGRMVESVKGSTKWKDAVKKAAVAVMADQPPLEGPIVASIVATMPRPKSRKGLLPITRSSGDLDKLVRNCLDAVSKVAIVDDSQVVLLCATKRYGDRIGVKIMLTVGT